MKTRTRLMVSLAFGVMLLFFLKLYPCVLYAATSGVTEDGYEYDIYSDGTACITGYTGKGTDLVIPEKVNGATVTGIGADAFDSGDLTSVKSNTVTNIGSAAFRFSKSLISVSFPQATDIGYAAFYGCESLISVSIPQATKIGEDAFKDCESLTNVSFPRLTDMGRQAFCGCRSLTSISFPQVTKIIYHTFENCESLVSVSFPQVTSIDFGAFENCKSLTSVSFPQVTSIGHNAFYGCESLTSVSFPQVTNIYDEAFLNCVKLTTLTLGNIVNYIGNNAFGYEERADESYVLIKGLTLYTPISNDNKAYAYAKENGIPVIDTSIPLKSVTSLISSIVYSGKIITPPVMVLDTNGKQVQSTDYLVSYENNKSVGTATITVEGKRLYSGTINTTFKITKATNPLKIKGNTAKIKYSKLKKKNLTLAVKKVIKVTKKGIGKLTYKKVSGSKKITINKKTGKVTVKKGLKKGKYKLKVKVKAAGNKNYNASAAKKASFTIIVK